MGGRKPQWWHFAEVWRSETNEIHDNQLPEFAAPIVFLHWDRHAKTNLYQEHFLLQLLRESGAVVVRFHREDKKRKAFVELENVEQVLMARAVIHKKIHDGDKVIFADFTTAKPLTVLPSVPRTLKSGPVKGAPGLVIDLEMVTRAQEAELIGHLDALAWAPGVAKKGDKSRHVQHFGYRFNYVTKRADAEALGGMPGFLSNNGLMDAINKRVNEAEQSAPPVDFVPPANGSTCTAAPCSETTNENNDSSASETTESPANSEAIDRTCTSSSEQEVSCTSRSREEVEKWVPDQLTVNEYFPGQGIGAHVDTHSAFTGAIVALSLGADIVMRFDKGLGGPDSPSFEMVLPRRSLLIMCGESRLNFLHSISHRTTDHVEDVVIERTRRLSLTFRQVAKVAECKCPFPPLCDAQGGWGSAEAKLKESDAAAVAAAAALVSAAAPAARATPVDPVATVTAQTDGAGSSEPDMLS